MFASMPEIAPISAGICSDGREVTAGRDGRLEPSPSRAPPVAGSPDPSGRVVSEIARQRAQPPPQLQRGRLVQPRIGGGCSNRATWCNR